VQLDGFEQEQDDEDPSDPTRAEIPKKSRKKWKAHPTNPELQWDEKTGETRPAETVRVYTFGLPLGPTENAYLVERQMRLAATLRNKYTEIIRTGRRDYRALVGEVPDRKTIDGKIKALSEERAQIEAISKKANITARKRGADPEAKAKKATLSAQIKKLREEKKATKISDPVVLKAIDVGNNRVKTALKTAYGEAGKEGAYWGTRLFVAAIAQKQKSLKGTDPKFRRWDGSGVVAVHIQGRELTVREVYKQRDAEVRIDVMPRRRFSRKHPEGVEIPRSCTLRFRVESDKGKPVWATFPMLLDERGLPEDGTIEWVRIHRRRDGTKLKWEVHFVVSVLSSSIAKLKRVTEDLSVGIDVGWSIVRGGELRCESRRTTREGVETDRCGHHRELRIGFCAGSDGKFAEILLEPDIECSLSYANSIRSLRDKLFGGRPKPKKVLDEHGNEVEVEVDFVPEPDQPPTIVQLVREWCGGRELPAALAEVLGGIEKWRSSARMQKVYETWRNISVSGDETIFLALKAWANRDRHLYQIESRVRGKALLRRREFYRTWAKSLVSEYRTVFIEDFDLRDAAKGKIAGGMRTVAAIHEFRDALKLAAANSGAEVIKVDKNGTSRTCSDCSGRIEWRDGDDKDYHNPKCTGCGKKWDRDHNASNNILSRGLADVASRERFASGSTAPKVPDPLAIE
jgi:hypothetical protein